MLTSDFLRRVLPPAGDGWYCWATPAPANDKGRRYNQRFTRYLSHVVDGTTQCDDAHVNTYYAMSSFKERGTRVQDNVAYVKAFWIDIDCGADKAAAGKGYATQIDGIKALLDATKSLGLPRPMLVNSGNGVHVYWPLAEAITPDVWRPIACQLVAAYQEQGLIADWGCSTDHSRILRPVGTHNWKDPSNPKPVTLLADCPDYPLDSIAGPVKHYVVAVPTSRYDSLGINSDLGLPQEPPSSVPDVVADRCGQVALFRDTRGCLPEPQWRAGIAVVKACIDGEQTVHLWSSGYEGYSADETDLKIRQTKGPTTCASFERLDPAICKGCAYRGTITSPIQLGRPEPVEQTEAVTEPDSPAAVDDVVEQFAAEMAAKEPVKEKLPAMPLAMRRTYMWTDQGMCVRKVVPLPQKDGDDGPPKTEAQWVPFTDQYIICTQHVDLGGKSHMRLMVQKRRGRAFQFIDMPSALVQEKQALLKWLAENGMGPLSDYRHKENAEEMHLYLKRWFDEAKARVEETRQHTHLGWQEDGGFLIGERLLKPGAETRKVSLGGDAYALAPAFTQNGTVEEWTDAINRIYGGEGMEAYQFSIACGFGTALMSMLDQTGVMIAMYSSQSGVGKTSVAKAALSIWGDPDKITVNHQQVTQNALIGRLGALHDLPCYVDEITTARGNVLTNLAYDVSGGQSKSRAARSGDIKAPKSSWNTMMLVSGNSSVWQRIGTTMTYAEGPLMRVLEYKLTKHFESSEESRELFAKLANNYGTAGDVFIRFIVDNVDTVAKQVVKMQTQISKKASMLDSERFWRDGVAAALVGVSIAQRLGLVSFNLPALMDWCVNRVVECRNRIVGVQQSDEDSFGRMVNDLAGGIIVTDRLGTVESTVLAERRPNGAIYGRQVTDEGKLYLTVSSVKRWCAENNANSEELIADARTRGVVEGSMMFQPGFGTDIPTQPERCIIIRVTVQENGDSP